MADLKHVKEQALELAPEARASLVDVLIESLDVESSEAVTQAWFEEVRRRRSQFSSGGVGLISGDELLAGIEKPG
ncbi:MAG: addiction module protein [Thermoanaerobaculia bacterium]